MIIGTYSAGSASAYEYSTFEELLSQLPDNTSNLIEAINVRNSIYSLWMNTGTNSNVQDDCSIIHKQLVKNAMYFPHGTCIIKDNEGNDKFMFVSGVYFGQIGLFDLNNLNNYIIANVGGSISQAVFDQDNNKIYFIRGSYIYTITDSICAINLSNPPQLTDVNNWYVVCNTLSFTGFPSLCTDGNFIYAIDYVTPAILYKILISDGTIVKSATWSNGNVGHNCKMSKNKDEFYCTSAFAMQGDGSQFSKVNCDTMDIKDVRLETFVATDDMGYQYLDSNGGYCYIGGESNNIGSRIDTRDMSVTKFYAPHTYCVANDDSDLYITDIETHAIYKYANFDITKFEVYPFPNTFQVEHINFNGQNPNSGKVDLQTSFGHFIINGGDSASDIQERFRLLAYTELSAITFTGDFINGFDLIYTGYPRYVNPLSVIDNTLAITTEVDYFDEISHDGDFILSILTSNTFRIDMSLSSTQPILDDNLIFFIADNGKHGNNYRYFNSDRLIKWTNTDGLYYTDISVLEPCDFLLNPPIVHLEIVLKKTDVDCNTSVIIPGEYDDFPNELLFSNGRIFYTTYGSSFNYGELELIKLPENEVSFIIKNGNQIDNISIFPWSFLQGRDLNNTGSNTILSGKHLYNTGNNALLIGNKFSNDFDNICKLYKYISIGSRGYLYNPLEDKIGAINPRFGLDINTSPIQKIVLSPLATLGASFSGLYNINDRIDYIIDAFYDSIYEGRIFSNDSLLSITLINATSSVDINLRPIFPPNYDNTFTFNPTGFRIAKQVNGSGFNDFIDLNISNNDDQILHDDGSNQGWTHGLYTFMPKLASENILSSSANIQGKLGVNIIPDSSNSLVNFYGSISTKVRQIDISGSIMPNDHILEVINGGINLTLLRSGIMAYNHIIIKNVSTGIISLSTIDFDHFDDGSTSISITPGGCLYTISDGISSWLIISNFDNSRYFYSINIDASSSENIRFVLPEISSLSSDKMFIFNFTDTNFKAGINTNGIDIFVYPTNTLLVGNTYYQATGEGQVTFISCKNQGGWRIQSEVYDKFSRMHVEDNYFNILNPHWSIDPLSAGEVVFGQNGGESAVNIVTNDGGSDIMRLTFGFHPLLVLQTNKPIFDIILRLYQLENVKFRLGFSDIEDGYGVENSYMSVLYDSATSSNWNLNCTNYGSGVNSIDTNVLATTEKLRFTLYWVKKYEDVNGRIELYINGNLVATENDSTFIPTGGLQPFIEISNLEALSKRLYLYFSDVSWVNGNIYL